MSVFEKLKNALFEEEYVEVEEKPKKVSKRDRVKAKESKENIKEKRKEEKPIAKKVVLPGRKEVKVTALDDEEKEEILNFEDPQDNNFLESDPLEHDHNDFKIMDDQDFQVDEVRPVDSEPKIVKVIEDDEDEDLFYQEPLNTSIYHGKSRKQERQKSPYGMDEDDSIVTPYYGGAYERKEDRTYFKPSPIISPIYGILDKNYKKEDIVSKKEVRLTSSYARENLSVDDVRNKAYGNLSDDIVHSIDVSNEKTGFDLNDESHDDNLLVDLSQDDEKPTVKEVTMGDALEYFQDLGLEYNVDYKDASKEKVTGRRVKENYDTTEEADLDAFKAPKRRTDSTKVSNMENDIVKEKLSSRDIDVDSDDNLFDLIDSMYQEEE